MGRSRIGWTDTVWNPVTGCSRVSPGCEHCYAETLSLRRGWSKKPWTARNAAENVVIHPERFGQPLRWRKPRMVFVNSMSDAFHDQVSFTTLAQWFGVMAATPQHIYQILTKRPERAHQFLKLTSETIGWPLPNVWFGVSVEDQRRWDERIETLGLISACVRFVSLEPLLGPIDYGNAFDAPPDGSLYRPVDWVIVGGESGPGYRPMKIEWLESIVEECQAANVPVFVKQDSGLRPGKQGRIPDQLWTLKQFPKVIA